MIVKEVLRELEYEDVVYALRNHYPEKYEDIQSGYYRTLMGRLVLGKESRESWIVSVRPETAERINFFEEGRKEKMYAIYNLSEAAFLGLKVLTDELNQFGKPLYVAHLLAEWGHGDQFSGGEEFRCVEPNDHLPGYHDDAGVDQISE